MDNHRPTALSPAQTAVVLNVAAALAVGIATIIIGQAFAPASLLTLAAIVLLAALSGRLPVLGLDRLALSGLALIAVGFAVAGVAGGMGAAFAWLMLGATRDALRRAQAIAASEPGGDPRLLLRAHIVLWPLFAFALVAAAAPHVLLGLPLDLPRPPAWLVAVLGAGAAIAGAEALLRGLTRWRLCEPRWTAAAQDGAWTALIVFAFVLSHDVSAGVMGLLAYRLSLVAGLKLPSLTDVSAALGHPRQPAQASRTAVP